MSQQSAPRLRAAIVGAGYVAPYHIRAVQSLPFAEVAGIADTDLARAQQMASRFGIPHAASSLAGLAPARPDAVHILTPPATHAELALEALDMGCHVFVEKPMAESAADCDRMIGRARQLGKVLSVNHSARMDHVVLRALELVRSGAIGEVLAVNFLRSSEYGGLTAAGLPPWFTKGSYPLQDLGVHGMYVIEEFLGPIESMSVSRRSTCNHPYVIFDEWHATLECQRGRGQMYLSWNVRPMQNDFIVQGTRGVMYIDSYLQTLTVRGTWPAPKPIQRVLSGVLNSLQLAVELPWNALRFMTGSLVPSPGIHVSTVKFYEALQAGAPPPVPPEEGRRMIALLEGPSREADQARDAIFAGSPPATAPRVLVTGASGFLGRALVKRLREQGGAVRVLVRRPVRIWDGDPGVHVVYGDLADPAAIQRAVEGVEIVYHAGAAMRGGAEDFRVATVGGTRAVVEACFRHGVRRLVYVSSLSVHDHAGRAPGAAVKEDAPYEPFPERRGAYTQTKLEAERIVLDAMRTRNLPAVVLRPGQIFGPGAETVAPSGAIALAGRWIIVGSGELRLPLVYVDDAADALAAAGESGAALGNVYQIADPHPVTQNEYARTAAASLPDKIKPLRLPRWFMMGAALGVELLGKLLKRNVPLTRYRVRSLRPLHPCDVSAAQRDLGWTPRTGAAEGLRRTYPPARG
jgi:nucleoside-diphosphate-sugar epimerase/predicted dehydrogenase